MTKDSIQRWQYTTFINNMAIWLWVYMGNTLRIKSKISVITKQHAASYHHRQVVCLTNKAAFGMCNVVTFTRSFIHSAKATQHSSQNCKKRFVWTLDTRSSKGVVCMLQRYFTRRTFALISVLTKHSTQ